MKVTIITVVYNGRNTISSCIDSVLMQDYDNIEYIIIDGKSSDGTIEVIRSYENRIFRLISEPDKGIYDAMNKGLDLATGDVIGLLNADDFYESKTVISSIVETFKATGADGVFGDLQYVDAADQSKVTRNWVAGIYKKGSFLHGWMPPHPTLFLKKSVYKNFGFFRLDIGSAADYELMLRFIHKAGIKIAYVPRILVKMRAGGVSNSSIANRLAANRNDRKAWTVNGLNPHFYTLWLKPLRKILQFL
ncbi:glycosyltransferase family 2 protein [Dyadobacter psychrotolerans]|uniref:Glycosyltransferase n=1 Tax=Dyadobacter psychrotolerans TaxID=2541721 RepID=A0A4R5DYA1_9BACT|nr:glycosyltransferase family 2 protein [Dyadobacter psychrotolerans]TDE17460.1 glycosyltransferase [Dyadobacter psychrotolerans]